MILFKSLFTKFFTKLFLIHLVFLITTSSAFATGGTITFSLASPTAVPTLSGMMLIILSLLLVVVAIKIGKQNNNAGKFFITILGVTALVSGGSGIKLVSDAQAGLGLGNTSIIFNPGETTSTVTLTPNQAYHFLNDINPPQSINVTAAGPDEGSICDYYADITPVGVLDCLALPSLAPGEICGIGCRSVLGGGGAKTSAKPTANTWR